MPSTRAKEGERTERTGGASSCVSSGTMWTSPLSTRIDIGGVGFAVTFAKTPSLSVPPPRGRPSPAPGTRWYDCGRKEPNILWNSDVDCCRGGERTTGDVGSKPFELP